MRRWLLVLMTALAALDAAAQQRYAVSATAEVVPLGPNESAREVLTARLRRLSASAAVCPDKYVYGFPPEIYIVNSNFGAYHREVVADWFVAPASGTIDTIFWYNRHAVGAYDSTVRVRIHRSVIGPAYGPGVRPGPFAPPCQNWGYWVNANDSDQGIAAFREEATDTVWRSTYNGPVQTLPPVGEELWGLGGFPVRIHADSVAFAAMADLATPVPVTTGDQFFVSIAIAAKPDSIGGHIDPAVEVRTEFNASGFDVSTADPEYPSHNWKFYEHDAGPSNCSGVAPDSIRRGWVARGGFGPDSLTVAAFNIWYVMTVVSNVAPVFVDDYGIIPPLCCGAPRSVWFSIDDCDPANPELAGVDSATLGYTIDGVPQSDLPLEFTGGNTWVGTFPSPMASGVYRYRARAIDKAGAVGYSPWIEYTPASSTSVEEERTFPAAFELRQNYPNPFNPVTTISYAVPRSAEVRVRVLDILGRVVATLVDGVVPPGVHEAQFDASRLPSGVYLCRMEAGPFSAGRKILLLR